MSSPAMEAANVPRWRLSPGQQLHCHNWDADEFVLFNDLAGDTHLLDQDAFDVLHLLRDAADGGAETSVLAELLGLDTEQAEVLAELLEKLYRLSLIERATC